MAGEMQAGLVPGGAGGAIAQIEVLPPQVRYALYARSMPIPVCSGWDGLGC